MSPLWSKKFDDSTINMTSIFHLKRRQRYDKQQTNKQKHNDVQETITSKHYDKQQTNNDVIGLRTVTQG